MTEQTLKDIDRAFKALEERDELLGKLRAEIQTEYDGILWHYNDYDDGWSDALKWVLEVIDKYMDGGE